jgi:hypothetical protein
MELQNFSENVRLRMHPSYKYVRGRKLPLYERQTEVFYLTLLQITKIIYRPCGPGSSVGIETGYRLDGSGIESRWGRDFPHLSRPTMGLTQPPVQWVPALSRGYRAAGA